MRARSIPFGSMFAWIPSTFRLVMDHVGPMVVATLLTIVVWLACYLPVFAWMFKSMMGRGLAGLVTMQQETTYWVLYGISMLIGLVVMAPVLAGWMRLCASADRKEPVSGLQVLALLKDGAAWRRLMAFTVMWIAMFAVFAGLMYLLFGDALRAIVAMQEAQNAALLAGAKPAPPDTGVLGQVFLLYVIALPCVVLMQLVVLVGIADISLQHSSATGAFADSALGVLRNLVKLLVFMFCLFCGFIVLMLVVGIVLVLLFMALAMLSPVVAAVVLGLVYFAFLLVLYPLMFASNYFVWKDMLGGEEPVAANAVAV